MEATMGLRNVPNIMGASGLSLSFNTLIIGGIIVTLVSFVIRYVISRQSVNQAQDMSKIQSNAEKYSSAEHPPQSSVSSIKRGKQKKRREVQQEFTHSWLAGTLRGHTGQVNDIHFSANGRHLASCADDRGSEERNKYPEEKQRASYKMFPVYVDNQFFFITGEQQNAPQLRHPPQWYLNPANNIQTPGNQLITEYRSNIVYTPNQTRVEIFCRHSDPQPRGTHPSRMQVPIVNVSNTGTIPKNDSFKGERLQIDCSDDEIADALEPYVLSTNELYKYGYPMTVTDSITSYVAVNYTPYPNQRMKNPSNAVNNDADCNDSLDNISEHLDNEHDQLKGQVYDKICYYEEQELLFQEEEEKENVEQALGQERKKKELSKKKSSKLGISELDKTHVCSRCNKTFLTDDNNKYLSKENCFYHSGKLRCSRNKGMASSQYWTCCFKEEPCTKANMHVWVGVYPGCNIAQLNYVQTICSDPLPGRRHHGVFGLDCEMCYTRHGLELARVSVVDMYGRTVYDTLVKPENEIIDYNTIFSGITENDMVNVSKTIYDVQRDLLTFINSSTILVGHGLDSDLRVLRLLHNKVVDTSVIFKHTLGFPYRNSLKTMALRVLKRTIQENMHDSIEDARAAMDLMMKRVQHDMKRYPDRRKIPKEIFRQDLQTT